MDFSVVNPFIQSTSIYRQVESKIVSTRDKMHCCLGAYTVVGRGSQLKKQN